MPYLLGIFSFGIQFYMLLIFIWSLASWFPQWRSSGWYRLVEDIVTPYLNLFRGLNLRSGGFDFTPMIALFALYLFRIAVFAAVNSGGAL